MKSVLKYFNKTVKPKIFPVILDESTDISDLKNNLIYLVIDFFLKNNPDQGKATVVCPCFHLISVIRVILFDKS